MSVEFGIFPVPNAAEADELLERVTAAEQAGLDLVGIQDHPYQRRFLDTWSLNPVPRGAHEQDPLLPGRREPAAQAAGRDGEGGGHDRPPVGWPLRARPRRGRLLGG